MSKLRIVPALSEDSLHTNPRNPHADFLTNLIQQPLHRRQDDEAHKEYVLNANI